MLSLENDALFCSAETGENLREVMDAIEYKLFHIRKESANDQEW